MEDYHKILALVRSCRLSFDFARAGIFISETLPSCTVVMATGAEGGANHGSASVTVKSWRNPASHYSCCQHRALLKSARLRDPRSGVSVGFVQGGTTSRKESLGLESLDPCFTSHCGSSTEVKLEQISKRYAADGYNWP